MGDYNSHDIQEAVETAKRNRLDEFLFQDPFGRRRKKNHGEVEGAQHEEKKEKYQYHEPQAVAEEAKDQVLGTMEAQRRSTRDTRRSSCRTRDTRDTRRSSRRTRDTRDTRRSSRCTRDTRDTRRSSRCTCDSTQRNSEFSPLT